MSTARHAAATQTPMIIVLYRFLKYWFGRQRYPLTPLNELFVEEFTSEQVADMRANERSAMKYIAIITVVAAIIIAIYLVAIQHFVNNEIGPLFDNLMKPPPGTSR